MPGAGGGGVVWEVSGSLPVATAAALLFSVLNVDTRNASLERRLPLSKECLPATSPYRGGNRGSER